jgi:hypothetical protein
VKVLNKTDFLQKYYAYRQKYFFIKVKEVELLVLHKICTVIAPTKGAIAFIKFKCK